MHFIGFNLKKLTFWISNSHVFRLSQSKVIDTCFWATWGVVCNTSTIKIGMTISSSAVPQMLQVWKSAWM